MHCSPSQLCNAICPSQDKNIHSHPAQQNQLIGLGFPARLWKEWLKIEMKKELDLDFWHLKPSKTDNPLKRLVSSSKRKIALVWIESKGKYLLWRLFLGGKMNCILALMDTLSLFWSSASGLLRGSFQTMITWNQIFAINNHNGGFTNAYLINMLSNVFEHS